ncbi:hypothetical protein JCM16303_001828 [Sporobolomyces ruberrimus]
MTPSPPPLSTIPTLPPPTKSSKRASPGSKSSTKPSKRARLNVAADETTQVSGLLEHRLNFADADVYYVPSFVEDDLAQQWYQELINIDGWYQPTLKMYGKEITQSRKIAAFATDRELTVKYSGALVDMQYHYPPLLQKIQSMVEEKLGVTFNHCMMNSYENGSVYIGNHRDNRENRVIASLSLGAPRTFIMEHDKPPSDAPATSKKPLKQTKSKSKTPLGTSSEPPSSIEQRTKDTPLYYKKWVLENGSLVVMQGSTQQSWKHQIPKEPKVKQGRISLTFRQLVF